MQIEYLSTIKAALRNMNSFMYSEQIRTEIIATNTEKHSCAHFENAS